MIFLLIVIISNHSPNLNFSLNSSDPITGSFNYYEDNLMGFYSSANYIVVAGVLRNDNNFSWMDPTLKLEMFDQNFHLLFEKRKSFPILAGASIYRIIVTEFKETIDGKYFLTCYIDYLAKNYTKTSAIVMYRISMDLNTIEIIQFNPPNLNFLQYFSEINTYLVDLTVSQKIYRVFYTDFYREQNFESKMLHFIDINTITFEIINLADFKEVCCINPSESTFVKWIYLEKDIQKYYFLILQAYSEISGKNFTVIFKNDSYGIEPYEVSYLPNYDYGNPIVRFPIGIFLTGINLITFTCFNKNQQYFYESPIIGLNPILKYTIEIPSQFTSTNVGFTYMSEGRIYLSRILNSPYNCIFYSKEMPLILNSQTMDNYFLFNRLSEFTNKMCIELYNFNQFNSSHIIFFQKASITHFNLNFFDFPGDILTVHLFTNQHLPNISKIIVGGGQGFSIPFIFPNYSEFSFLLYGKTSEGIYIIQVKKTNPNSIIYSNRFNADRAIQSYSIVKVDEGKIILIGNYIETNFIFPSFIGEIDEFLYPKIIDSPLWTSNFLITNAINLEPSKFSVVGTKLIQSNSKCYYAEINGKYVLLNETLITIEGKTCKINVIIQTLDHKIIGVGEVSRDSSIILFQMKPIFSFYIVKNYRNVSLNSISQINISNLLAAGIITDNSHEYPYYINFDSNLIPRGDISIMNTDGTNSKLTQISKKLIVNSNNCKNSKCLRFLSFIPFFTIIDEIPINIKHTSNYEPLSILSCDNKTLLIISSWNCLRGGSILSYSRITLNISCSDNFIYNPNDGICILDCLNQQLIDNYQCLEYDDKVCTNCQLMSNGLISDFFDLSKYFISVTKMIIIKNSIQFKKEENMIIFKFNNNAIFYPFPILLFLITTDGNLTSYVQYEYYQINGKSVKIINLALPKNLNNLFLQVDLTFLKIVNPLGAPLLNPIFNIDLSEFLINKQLLISKIIDAASTFINNKRNAINSGMIAFGLGLSCINLSMSAIIAIAEIIQFLSLFAFISISFYPKSILTIYQSQSIFNLNFIPIFYLSILNCAEFHNEDSFDGNTGNHPSLNCGLLYCNIISIISLFIIILSFILISKILTRKISNIIIKINSWNGFIGLVQGVFVDLIIILLIQIINV